MNFSFTQSYGILKHNQKISKWPWEISGETN